MLSGNKCKTGFTHWSSEPMWSMNLKGTKIDKFTEKGKKEFMESARLSHTQLEDKKNAHGSFPFLLLARHEFHNGVLKLCRLIYASEKSYFFGHKDTKGINNSNRFEYWILGQENVLNLTPVAH